MAWVCGWLRTLRYDMLGGGVCVKSSIFAQLHSARLGYGSCLGFLPLGLPQSCPQTTPPRTKVRGSAIKAGHPNLLSPKPPPPGGSGANRIDLNIFGIYLG